MGEGPPAPPGYRLYYEWLMAGEGRDRANPQNWLHVAASSEAARFGKASGGISIPNWYRNKITGEEIGMHDVIGVSGKSIKKHPDPVGLKGN